MGALCSNVCSAGDTIKVDASPALAAGAMAKGQVPKSFSQQDGGSSSSKGSSMTLPFGGQIPAALAQAAQEDTFMAQVAQCQSLPEWLPKEHTTEGASLPPAAPLPPLKDLIRDCQTPSQIFATASHEICCFGSTLLNGNRAAREPEFEEKKLEISGGLSPNELRATLLELGIAVHCKKGKKPEQPNQDNVFFCKMCNFTICGVADGHGPDGHWVSHWTARFMMKLLMKEVSVANGLPGDEALARIFETSHQALHSRADSDRFDLKMSGSTLSICIVDHSKRSAVAAWVGDSRCALGRPGGVKGQSWTTDHKPQDKLENMRIKASGGEVVRLENDVPHRVFIRGGEVPGLAMSRAVGDLIAHSVGVIHLPGIVRVNLEDHFLLCCSDGVWEFIESDEATELVSKFGRKNVSDATEALTKEAYKRWIAEEQSLTDDISAICIWL